MDDLIFKQFIGGRWCNAADGSTWTLLNPATEEALGDLPYGGADAAAADTTAALDAAAQASSVGANAYLTIAL